jgi:hypothetical protein
VLLKSLLYRSFNAALPCLVLLLLSTRFVCCDLDGDSRLAPQEMRHFYKVQLHRVTSLVSVLRRSLIRSYVIRSYVIRSYVIRSYVIRSYVIRSYVIRSYVIRSYVIRLETK